MTLFFSALVTAVPPCVVGPSLKDALPVESAEKGHLETKACDASTSRKGQKDDLIEADFAIRNSETIISSSAIDIFSQHCKSPEPSSQPKTLVEERVGDDPVQAYNDTHDVSVDPASQDRLQSRRTSPDTVTTVYQDIQIDETEIELVHSVQLNATAPSGSGKRKLLRSTLSMTSLSQQTLSPSPLTL